MQATADREQVITEIALGIDGALADWETGRNASPDQRDYVIIARETLERRFPNYVAPDSERENDLADVLYEDAGETYVTVRDIATFLYDELSLGIPA